MNTTLINNFFKRTHQYDWVTNKEIYLGDSIIESDYESINQEIGIDLRHSFNDVFSEHDKFKFILYANDNVISECTIDGLIMTFNEFGQEHYIHAFDEFGEEFISFARQFYPLDIYEKACDETTLVVVKPITLVNDKMEFWIWNNVGPKYKLRFETFGEYLETGISCRFCIFWQYFYLDTKAMDFNDPFTKEWIANNFNGATSRMKTALTSMKEHFPKEDWSYQEGELERVKLLE